MIPRLAYSNIIPNLSFLEPGNGPGVLSTTESGWFSRALNLLINLALPENENGFYCPRSPNNEYRKTGYIGRILCQELEAREDTPHRNFCLPSVHLCIQ